MQSEEVIPRKFASHGAHKQMLPQVKRELFNLLDQDLQNNLQDSLKYKVTQQSSAAKDFVLQKNMQTRDIINLVSNNAYS